MLRKARNLLLKFLALAVVLAVVLAYLAYEFTRLSSNNERVEHLLSQQIGTDVQIRQAKTTWQGLRPRVIISGLRLRQTGSEKSIGRLGQLRFTLNPFPLLWGELSFTELQLNGPTLTMRREVDGRIMFGGMPILGKDHGSTGSGFLDWLFQQDQIELRDGTLAWSDATIDEQGIELTHIDLLIQRTGDRRRFNGRLRLPDSEQLDVTLEGQFFGHPLDEETKGNLSLVTQQVALAKLPTVIKERVPWQLKGNANLNLYLAWAKGELVAAQSRIELDEFSARLPTGNQLAASDGSAEIDWRRTAQRASVTRFTNVQLKNQGEIVEFPEITLEQDKNKLQARVTDSTLAGIIRKIKTLGISLPDWLNTKANATLKETVFEYWFNQEHPWSLTAQLINAAYLASDGQLELSNFSGQLRINKDGGSIMLNTRDASFSYLSWFDQQIAIKRLNGEIGWQLTNSQWRIEANNVLAEAAGVKASIDRVVVPWQKNVRDYSDLLISARVAHATIAEAKALIPKNIPSKLYRWLNQALVSGELVNGTAHLRGDLRKLKLDNPDNGVELLVSAGIKDGVLKYHPKWPVINNLKGNINFTESGFEAQVVEGQFLNTEVKDAAVVSRNLYHRDRNISIQVAADAPLLDVVNFLSDGPLLSKLDSKTELSAKGSGKLNLELELPLAAIKTTSVNGSYQFSSGGITVGKDLRFSDVTASVKFSENSVSSDRITASFLGGQIESRLSSSGLRTPTWKIDFTGHGDAKARQLNSLVGKQLAAYLDGKLQWRGSTGFDRKGISINIDSELQGLAVNLPAPLNKTAKSSLPFSLSAEFLNRGSRNIQFQQQGKVAGLLQWRATTTGHEFSGGNLLVGKGTLTKKINPVLRVDINLDQLDFDPWLATLKRSAQTHTVEQHSEPMAALREIRAEVKNFRMLDKELGILSLNAFTKDADRWIAKLKGESLAGTMVAVTHTSPVKLDFELSYLNWPKADNEQDKQQDIEPTKLPEIHIGADKFEFKGRDLGQLIFRAHPVEAGWRVGYLQIDNPDWQLLADGLWSRQDGLQRSSFQIDAQTDHLGKALASIGYPDQVKEGKAKIAASLYWNDIPGNFSWQKLNGSYKINASKGRFLSVNPGTGRLFGLFNIEALARRFILDFSDVFKKGLAFDRMSGAGIIDNGNLYSDGIYIAGPAVLIEMQGRIGLAEEDYDLSVSVAPQWGANLSFLGALANPAVGAALFLAQKLFKKKLSKLVRYRYKVTGFWDDPTTDRAKIDPDKK